MDRATIEPVITLLLTEIHIKLTEATRIAKAAEACALAGSIAEGVTVSMDIEQLIYDADHLQGAASLLTGLWGKYPRLSFPCSPAKPTAGPCQWQHMMLSLNRTGEPGG